MSDKGNTEPQEMNVEELRRTMAAMGTPLTPNVVNRDNEWLEPIGGIVGHVSEVNGAGAQEVPGFVPTRHELSVLVKHWMTEIIQYAFWFFCYEQACSSHCRRSSFAGRRIDRIAAFIGNDAVERAIDEAYEEYGQTNNSDAWRIFLHGTDEERRAFRAECDAREAASAREYEDQFCVSILKFLAGEPHDIQPGTVGMAQAEIAKTLVSENPALAAPENKEKLLKAIRDRETSHLVHFDKSDVAAIRALVDPSGR